MSTHSNGGLKIPSTPPTSSRVSLAPAQSIRSSRGLGTGQSTLRSIVTAPPWAYDEPPSPTDDPDDNTLRRPSDVRHSDVASYQSSGQGGPDDISRWWSLTRPRHSEHSQHRTPGEGHSQPLPKPERRAVAFMDRSMSWLPTSNRRSQDVTGSSPSRPKGFEGHRPSVSGHHSDWGLTIDMPPPPSAPFTMSHSRTPGWESPWTPRAARYGFNEGGDSSGQDEDDSEKVMTRRKRLRRFVLHNPYVPLLFRFINITFTTAALAVAIRIRIYERLSHSMGAVGSSPTLVIIFAPLTLVHVMVAIYLEYFGRPLGLWNTSSKLAHTLGEVLFICAWSAALSLSFDNFFTSLIPCAAPSSTSWYNELPRPVDSLPGLGRHEGGIGDRICDDQLVLIVLVVIGLIMYCINLIISLFRIFEKVKYHPGVRLNS